MKNNGLYVLLMVAVFVLVSTTTGCADKREASVVADKTGPIKVYSYEKGGFVMSEKIVKTEAEWKKHDRH